MATIRRIVQTNPVSDYSTFQPRAGGAFDLLATAAETAFERFDSLARKEAEEKGKAAGYEAAQGGSMLPQGSGEPLSFGEGVTPMAQEALTRLQTAFGRPLNVISDYRDPEHNARVGGAKNSQHTHGNAFDIDVSGLSQEERVALIEQARAAGFRGIGVYDNSLHFDVAGDRAWGPSYSRDSLPAWAASAVTAPVGGGAPAMPTVATKDPTTGEMKGLPEVALSGPYREIYDHYAGIAYQGEVLSRAGTDLQQLALQYPFNPEGYRQAADAYVRQIIQSAPESLRPDIGIALADDARRITLGLQSDKMRDIENRANNATAALVDRYSLELSEALTTDDPIAIENARMQLDSVLRARETLPGVGWTPEQSANVLMGAEREASAIRERRASEGNRQIKANLDLAIDAARVGRTSVYDGLAVDPMVQAAFPELTNELLAFQELNAAIPNLATLPEAQRNLAVENLNSGDVATDFQIDLGKAAADANKRITEGWQESTIETAREYMTVPPPEFVDMTAADPEAFVQSLSDRRQYVNESIRDKGITADPLFLSAAERESFKAMLDPTMDPGIRGALATALVEGFGTDAGKVFTQLGIDDPVLKMGAMETAAGGDAATMQLALQGQALIREKAVTLPSDADVRAMPEYATTVQTLQDIVGATDAASDVVAYANAIYAATALGVDPKSADGQEAYRKAWQMALGESTDQRGRKTGGMKPIFGVETLLPVGVAADDLSTAISRAMGPAQSFVDRLIGLPAQAGMALLGQESAGPNMAAWEAAGGVPHYGGRPVTPDMFRNGKIRLVPMGNPSNPGLYRMEIAESKMPVSDASGRMLMVDVFTLMEAAKQQGPLWTPKPVGPQPPTTGPQADPMWGVWP